jgi:hypothetical protein
VILDELAHEEVPTIDVLHAAMVLGIEGYVYAGLVACEDRWPRRRGALQINTVQSRLGVCVSLPRSQRDEVGQSRPPPLRNSGIGPGSRALFRPKEAKEAPATFGVTELGRKRRTATQTLEATTGEIAK